MKTLLKLLLFLILLAVVAAVVLNFVLDRTKTETHAVSGKVTAIVVESDSGDVDLNPGDTVEVSETKHYVFKKSEYSQKLAGGTLTIKVDCDTPVIKCYSDLEVTVPTGVKVTVDVDSGDIDANEIDVRALNVRSDSGDIKAELEGRPLLVFAHTDSGDVEVIASDPRAVDAQTDSGDVKVNAGGKPLKIVARTDSGDVDVAVPKGNYKIDAKSDSGDVKIEGLKRKEASPKSIRAETDSGDVKLRAR